MAGYTCFQQKSVRRDSQPERKRGVCRGLSSSYSAPYTIVVSVLDVVRPSCSGEDKGESAAVHFEARVPDTFPVHEPQAQ
jgi:hypothetical protein